MCHEDVHLLFWPYWPVVRLPSCQLGSQSAQLGYQQVVRLVARLAHPHHRALAIYQGPLHTAFESSVPIFLLYGLWIASPYCENAVSLWRGMSRCWLSRWYLGSDLISREPTAQVAALSDPSV